MGHDERDVRTRIIDVKASEAMDSGATERGMATIKGYARERFMANYGSIHVVRLALSPMNRLSCGTQPAHIRLINRRRSISLSFGPLFGG